MNFYILLTLLVAGGIVLSFGVSYAVYYDNLSRVQYLHNQCPTMSEDCLSRLNIEPITPILAPLGLCVYIGFAVIQMLSHKKPNSREVKE